MRKTLVAMMLGMASAALIAGVAEARGGCGLGWHHGLFGVCVRNTAPPVDPNPLPVGRACPPGYHLGPEGQHCWRN